MAHQDHNLNCTQALPLFTPLQQLLPWLHKAQNLCPPPSLLSSAQPSPAGTGAAARLPRCSRQGGNRDASGRRQFTAALSAAAATAVYSLPVCVPLLVTHSHNSAKKGTAAMALLTDCRQLKRAHFTKFHSSSLGEEIFAQGIISKALACFQKTNL